jgi:hypothetical protein
MIEAVYVMVWDTKFEKLYSAQTGMTFHVRHQVLNTHFGVFHESAEWFWQTEESRVSANKGGPGRGSLMMHGALYAH